MSRHGSVVLSQMKEVVFGTEATTAVTELVDRMNARRVFLLVSGTLNRETPEIERIQSALGERFVASFDRIPAHSPRQAVVDAAAAARECGSDLIVTVGGGSVIDAGKAVQLCMANNMEDAASIDALRPVRAEDGKLRVPAYNPPTVRQIAVATTLSGAEFSAFAGVTDETRHAKDVIWHPGIVPAAAVLDPALTRHTPMPLFLSTGIRAIDHCIEGICSNQTNAYADAQALHGLMLLTRSLRRARSDPTDLDARLECQLGAWLSMAPLISGVPMGASHGIGYVLGASFGIPHGHTSCVMLPAVMRWNREHSRERQARVAKAMGISHDDPAIEVERLLGDLGMPRRLSEVGIGPEHFDLIAQQAMNAPWVPHNPRPVVGPGDVLQILALAA